MDCLVIVRAYWVCCGSHRLGVGITPCKDIGDFKAAKAQSARAPFAAFDRGVVLNLGGGRGVQHDEKSAFAVRVPRPSQAVAIAFAI